MNNPLLAILVNHLWQSALFAAAVGGLALLLRRNSARVRYALWLTASLKFLVPFAALAALGAQIPWTPDAAEAGSVAPRVVVVASEIAAPMEGYLPFPGMKPRGDESVQWMIALAAALVWTGGTLYFAGRWMVRWIGIRIALRRSTVLTGIDFPAPVLSTDQQLEPGVAGIFRAKLLLPAGIESRLTAEQLRAVLAHERCHLRWHDNLTASLHMVVETLFWYFPPVWWIGARLIDERERACDEQVVREGHAPGSYAEGILNVCEHYVASRLACVSGISGSDLRRRIERIVKKTLSMRLDRRRKLALAAVAGCSVAAPIAAGMLSGNALQSLFSLSPGTAAMTEYMRLGNASAQKQLAGFNARNMSLNTCPAPGEAVTGRQKQLAALVAKLSPGDSRALLYAVAANSRSDAQRLLAGGAARVGDGFLRPNSLMHIAAVFGDPSMLELLKNAGFGIDEVSRDGIGSGHTPLVDAVSAGRRDNVRWFIEQGVNVSTTDKYGSGALQPAMVTCRDEDLVRQLLKAGLKPNARALWLADMIDFDLRTDPAQPGPPLQSWRMPPKQTATADLDGDGVMDQIALHESVVDASFDVRYGVLVRLSSRDSGKWMRAAVNHVKPPVPTLTGIGIARPGTYRTRCSNANPCPVGRPVVSPLVLDRAGIELLQADGLRSIAYWDSKTRGFKRAWLAE